MLYFARWKIVLVGLICLAGLVFTAPNFLPAKTAESLPTWLPHNQINLGLDLQGGLHLLLEVDSRDLIRSRLQDLLEASKDALFSRASGERIGYTQQGIVDNAVVITLRDPSQTPEALERIRELSVPLPFNPLTGSGGGRDVEITNPSEGRIVVTLTEDAIRERVRSALEQSVEIIRRRIDELGTREPTIQRQGEDRILIQLPGVQDPERVKGILKATAKMVFRLVDATTSAQSVLAGGRPPGGTELLESYERSAGGKPVAHYVVQRRVMVSGENLVDAQSTTDQRTGEPVVSFRFDSTGAKRFGKVTQDNVGRPFAIVLDDRVISAPVIREPILGGAGIISGNFTFQETQDLALLLRAGALPAELKYLEERTVGPTLGADSVRAGKVAGVIGFVLVMVFMFATYGLFGLAANVALLINVVLILGALSGLQATLTLPGIAGIVLTMGMAVDANVLVFERIREEIRTGKTPFAAMEAGYRRAMGTIFDANLTTLMAAAILFAMGSGPVKGFAVTLGIGIITSVFTAVILTRLFLVGWLRRTRPAALPI